MYEKSAGGRDGRERRWAEEEYMTVSPSGVSVSWDARTHHEGITSKWAELRKVKKTNGWQCLIVSKTRAPGGCVGTSPSIRTRISKWLHWGAWSDEVHFAELGQLTHAHAHGTCYIVSK